MPSRHLEEGVLCCAWLSTAVLPVPCLLELRAKKQETLMLLSVGINSCTVWPVPCLLERRAERREDLVLLCPGISSGLSEAVHQQLFACTLFVRALSRETKGLGAALPWYQQLFIRSCLSAAVFLYLVY